MGASSNLLHLVVAALVIFSKDKIQNWG